MTPKLMSYNQIDFQSKFHLEAELNRIEKNVKELRGEFKKAGCLSFTVTQIWNKQGNNWYPNNLNNSFNGTKGKRCPWCRVR